MVLIETELIKNVQSERKQISNVDKYVYHSLRYFSDTGNDTYTKSVLANAILKFHTKPTLTYIGRKEQELDDEILSLYGRDMLDKIDEMKKPSKSKDELIQYVPKEEQDGGTHNSLNLQLTPEVKEECLTGYADGNTLEEALVQSYLSPFKSRLDRIEFKDNLIAYKDKKNVNHRILDAIINDRNEVVENADEININDEWYKNDNLSLTQAKERIDELGQKDKDKKLMALKRVCMNEGKQQSNIQEDYVRKDNANSFAETIFNVHPRTAEEYVDRITKFEGDPIIEKLTPNSRIKDKRIVDLKNPKNDKYKIKEGMELSEAERIVQKASVPNDSVDTLVHIDSGIRITEFEDDRNI